MEEKKINIPANVNNDLKLRTGLGEKYDPSKQKENPITEDGNKKKEQQLEYFTE